MAAYSVELTGSVCDQWSATLVVCIIFCGYRCIVFYNRLELVQL